MYLPRPSGIKVFQVVNMLFAAASTILGIIFIILGFVGFFSGLNFANAALSGMMFLYGSLATFYGIQDLIESIQSFRTPKP